ncbi:hypothetical protein DDB_G0270550 [Dictyostelium discoideum AX4]|uniref:Probable serine/threonine-protein kinase gdt4 n=1 Tax=Dictyostelium discoideum TaxID=44689 RepID=GDT4_DICDI|nr:hypothetical protein DDB_G0270550 [Dictyostelium discoideum AX4]Q55DU7.2 RecName: Full=Probable serine/threonine-protein kinase gdt4; AltName: Full=Growth-differentiation transition protein 4; Flags: Precursor [Dictyostelium discoideum]EAL72625.2 hypothetical protein DDB_G0270550 [Dictyostelium discoideum AX4]|eukprot:XP_646034.2 hypothetical protein DDB_G0270550 [Dictyostelium discoideum AX4]
MKLEQRIFFLICLVINSFSNCSLLVAPDGYYNIYRENKIENILNLKPNGNKSQDSYYPDVCSKAVKNKEGVKSFILSSFPLSTKEYANVIVTKGSHMTLGDGEYHQIFNINRFLNIVCVEGSLVFSTKDVVYMSALVILPGGNFECIDCTIKFRDLYPTNSLIDPFGFLPGIITLGGSLSLLGKQKTVYSAVLIDENILEVQDISSLDIFNGYSLFIFSESFPLGKASTFTFNSNQIKVLEIKIPKTDKSIRVFFYSRFSTFSTSTTASIHITGNSNVHIENFYIDSFGRTTNDQYSDTELIFSQDDPNLITGFINGSNQRFRSSLYIEHSNNVTIKNSVILENRGETRSPLIFFGSNVNISGNIISSKSGSSLIAQYGTENIQSTNNYYSLSLPLLKSLNSTLDSMDYGNEGNGIFSISPKINSINDIFNGQIIAINHIILSDRSSITGFDKDCYSPCYNDSIRVSSKVQHSVEFKITGSTFISSSNYSESSFLFRISETGSKQSSFYKIINSNLSYPISVLLENNAFILDNVYGFGNFTINGLIKRLDIINSTLDPSVTSSISLSNFSKAISIQNSFMDYRSFQKQNNQIYGSIITPYLYYFENTMNLIKVSKMYPNVNHQILAGTVLNMGIEIIIIAPLFGKMDCIFEDESGIQTIPFNKSSNSCVLPYLFKNEGSFNVRVTLSLTKSLDNIIFQVYFPMVTVFNIYSFYSGWAMIDSNIEKEIIIDGNIFKKGCQQQVLGNCTISTNSKLITGLPSVTESDKLNRLFSSGITSINPYEPVTITIPIDKESKKNQIQLFFTHQPIDIETSLLSIYVENQPIFLLEPLQSNLDSTFKNLTFHYENSKSLEKIKITFITRGDIYLTSTAIYSSTNQPIYNEVIGINEQLNILAIVLPITISLFAAASILAGYLVIKKYKKPNMYYNRNTNGNIGMKVFSTKFKRRPKKVIPLSIPLSTNRITKKSLQSLDSMAENPVILLSIPELEKANEPEFNPEKTFLQESELLDLPTPKVEPEEPRINIVPLPRFPTVYKKEDNDKLLKELNITGPITSENIESFFEVDVGLPSLIIKNESEIILQEIDYIETGEIQEMEGSFLEDKSTDTTVIVTKSDGLPKFFQTKVFSKRFNDISKFDNDFFDLKEYIVEHQEESFEIPFMTSEDEVDETKINIIDFLLSPKSNKVALNMYLKSFQNRNHKLCYGKYGSNKNSILVIEGTSYYYDCTDVRLPISTPRSNLNFGITDGNKCIVDRKYRERLQYINVYSEPFRIYTLFPDSNDNVTITTSECCKEIDPFGSLDVDIFVTLKTTTKFNEKVTIRYETDDKELAFSTFVYLNLESQVSSKIDFDEIVLEKYLSEGSFGVVYSAIWRSSSVAVKLFKHHYSKDEIDKETSILSKIKHPNIVSFIGSLNFLNTYGIVIDYHPRGSLNYYTRNQNIKLSMVQNIRISLDISRACSFLHKNGIIHRDLKPDNVLIVSFDPDSSICAKISDFGTCREINGKHELNSKAGTTRYMSPEILEGLPYTYSTDVYSFAILFFELLSGRVPFREIPKREIPRFVRLGTRPRLDQDVFADNDISLILLACWNPNPRGRPTFDTLIDLLEKLLKKYKERAKRNKKNQNQ